MINQFFEEDLALRRDRDPKLTFGKVSVSSSSSGVFHWLVCSKREQTVWPMKITPEEPTHSRTRCSGRRQTNDASLLWCVCLLSICLEWVGRKCLALRRGVGCKLSLTSNAHFLDLALQGRGPIPSLSLSSPQHFISLSSDTSFPIIGYPMKRSVRKRLALRRE